MWLCCISEAQSFVSMTALTEVSEDRSHSLTIKSLKVTSTALGVNEDLLKTVQAGELT